MRAVYGTILLLQAQKKQIQPRMREKDGVSWDKHTKHKKQLSKLVRTTHRQEIQSEENRRKRNAQHK